jgi:hypothetical protein
MVGSGSLADEEGSVSLGALGHVATATAPSDAATLARS